LDNKANKQNGQTNRCITKAQLEAPGAPQDGQSNQHSIHHSSNCAYSTRVLAVEL